MSFPKVVLMTATCVGLAIFGVLGCSSSGDDDDGAQSGAGGGSSSGTGGMPAGGSSGTGGATGGSSGNGGTGGSNGGSGGSAGKGANGGGGNGGAGSGAGGSSGTGGSAAGGGGEAAVAHGAVSLDIRTGPDCELTPQFLDLPAVAGGHPVSADGATHPVADGTTTPEGAMRVKCELAAGVVDAWVINYQNGQSAEIGLLLPQSTSGPVGVTITVVGGESDYGGTEEMPCTGVVLTSTATSLLVKFSCATLYPKRDGTPGTCVLGDSYAYFDGCGPS